MRPRAQTVIPQKSAGSQGLAFRLRQLLTEHRANLPEAWMGLAIAERNWRMPGIALLAPLILAIQAVTNSLVYTGARHLLFVIPFLAIAAAHGATSLARLNVVGKAVGATLTVIYVAVSLYNFSTLYPHQHSA